MANYNAVDEEAKVKNKRKRVIVFTFIAVILVCAIAAPIIISQSKPQYQYKHTGLPQQQLTSKMTSWSTVPEEKEPRVNVNKTGTVFFISYSSYRCNTSP